MSSPKPRQLSTPVITAIAVLLGAVVGAWWVYGTNSGSGNGYPADSKTVALSTNDKECAAQSELAAELEPLVRGDVAAMSIRQPVENTPALSFLDEKGTSTSLDDFKGQVLLINLWATWCAPCRAEMPSLAKLQSELGGSDFKVLAINIDTGDQAKPRAFLNEIGVSNLGLYQDNTMEVFNTFKRKGLVLGLPATMLVDRQGCLFGVMNGPAEWASEDSFALVEKMIDISGKSPGVPAS